MLAAASGLWSNDTRHERLVVITQILQECFDNRATAIEMLEALRRQNFHLLVQDSAPASAGHTVSEMVRLQLDHEANVALTTTSPPGSTVLGRYPVMQEESACEGRGQPLDFGRYHFDTLLREVRYSGTCVTLPQREYDLALFMFRNMGRLLSRRTLIEAVWGRGVLEVDSRSLDVHMCRIRARLQLRRKNGFQLMARYGLGYELEVAETSKHSVFHMSDAGGGSDRTVVSAIST